MSNTITAYFKGRIGVAESVYQNDYGMVMVFDSINLPTRFDCYFSHANQEEALPGLGADNRVAIPNSILANSGDVTIHIPVHTGENDSEVEYVVYFKVIGRARPIDDGTPEQMTAVAHAIALLQEPIGNIEDIVNESLAFTGKTLDDLQTNMNNVKHDFATVESDFDNLQAQFDTAVAAVTTDTEVTNIRVGDDNVTYATAGEAVRKQFAAVKDYVGNVAKLADITVDPSDWEAGSLNTTTGEEAVSPYTIRTKRFYLGAGYFWFTGVVKGDDESENRLAWVYAYDNKGVFLGRVDLVGRAFAWKSFGAFADIAYVRFVYAFKSTSGITVEDYGMENLAADWDADIQSILRGYLGSGGEIVDGDLDDYTESGIYVLTNAEASIVAHTPGNLGGILTVVKPDVNAAVLYQMYTQNNNELFVRFKTSTAWLDWFSVVGRQGAIQSGTNIDDVLVHGAYTVTNTVVPTLSNYPSAQGGVLVVYTPVPTGFPKAQTLYTYDGKVYTRIRQTTRYTEWSNATNAICDTSKEARIISTALRKLFIDSIATYSTLPKENGEIGITEYYNTGDKIKGVIYSSAWREGNDIYWNKTLETYYSALANPASILYTDDITDMGIYNAHAVWGGVCSTFVSYFLNFPYYTTTADLASRLVDKEMDSLDEIEVGDILLKDGHIAMVSQVYTDDAGGIISIDVSEQTLPRFKTTNVEFASLENYLNRNGYVVKQNTFGKPRSMGKTEYAEDIIFEYGNNTYVDIADATDMWFYVPDANFVYYKKNDAESYSMVTLANVPAETVNGVTVYNLKSIFDGVGDYLLTTDMDNSKQCLIKVIDIGTATISNGVLTLSDYQNCTPKQYYMVNLVSGEESAKEFDPPEGYHTTFPNKHHYIESDIVTIEDIPASGKYKLCIDYETGLGYKRILSANIGI